MTLDTSAVAAAPVAGQETATSNDTGNELDNRYSGILDIDANEPANTDNLPGDGEIAQEGDGDEAPDVADPWAGYEDFEVDGKTLKIPAEAKPYMLREADYTRKSQANAEFAKQLQAREQDLQQRYQRSEEEFNAYVEITDITNKLKPVENIDWAAEYVKLMNDPKQNEDYISWQNDLNKFNALRMQVQQLEQRRAGLFNTAQQAQQQRTIAEQQETAKRLQATRAFAEKNIKGWTPDLDNKITEFALTVGKYSPEVLRRELTPENYNILHLAYLGHQSQLRQQAARPTPQAKPPAATQTVSAKANPAISVDLERSTMADYIKARSAGKL